MSLSAEKLAEIDAELESFGKSDDELAAVVRRARAAAAEASGDAGLAELLEGLDEAVAAARAARRARPALPTGTAVGHAAPPETAEEELGSGLIEIPESEIRKADLPPVLELEPKAGEAEAAPFREEQTTTSGELEDAFEEGVGSDISGLSVDELFADAAPSGPASESDLTDLFDDGGDEEPIRLSDPEIELEAIEAKAEEPAPRPRTMPPPLPPRAAAKKPPKIDAHAFADEETDQTLVGSIADLSDDDSFELLVDEDVLELEDDALVTEAGSETTDTAEGAAEPEPDEGDGKGGLISRILGRK